MNKAFAFLAGTLIGGGIGYFVGAIVAEVIAQKEWEREHGDDFEYEDLDEDSGNDDETNLEKEEPVLFMGHNKNARPVGKVKSYTEYFNKQGKPELAALVAKYNQGDVVLEEPRYGIEPDIQFEDDLEDPDVPGDIMIISKQDYANAEGFEAITLKYWEDDVVTDEHDNPIERPEDILGDDALVSFGELSEDEDVVYVRNETKRAVYEVVRTNKEYSAPVERLRRARRAVKEDRHAEEDNA